MARIKKFLGMIPFISAWVIAIYVGVRTTFYLEQSFSPPWPHLFALAVTISVFILINGVLFNRFIFKMIIDKNTPIFEYDSSKGAIYYPNENASEIVWSEVERIEILTTSDGPWSEDLWWLFFLKNTEEPINIPQCAKGSKEVLNVLKKYFPRHDDKSIIKAMGSTSEARFHIWPEKS